MSTNHAAKLYIGATRQNDGKTMATIGLFHALGQHIPKLGYMKPVGQQYVVINGAKIDKDAVLMKTAYQLEDDLCDMSPVAIRQGFTEEYIRTGRRSVIEGQIRRACERLSKGKDLLLLEGTGHAGVGSVIDTSNSDVAKMLKAKVILVSCGGLGKPIDELMLNRTKFEVDHTEIIGVIINKVRADKFEKIDELVRLGLARKKLPVLGVIPYIETLSSPRMRELMEDLDGQLICGEQGLQNYTGKMVIGAMPPRDALQYFSPRCLLITPGNRDDLILAAMSTSTITDRSQAVSGIVLTCGVEPHPNILRLVKQTDIPIILVQHDTFATATKISRSLCKIRPEETDKIKECGRLVSQYVDIDRILKALKR